MVPDQPQALLWNPAGLSLKKAAQMLGVWSGTVAILGGTEIFGLFLPRYDVFHLSRVAGLRLPFGRAVFPEVPQRSPQAVLASSGLTQAAERIVGCVARRNTIHLASAGAFRLFQNRQQLFPIGDLHYFSGNGRKARVRF